MTNVQPQTAKRQQVNGRPARMMYCRVCVRWTAHVFVGVQEFGRHGSLNLYNCTCGATTSEPAHE